MPNQMGNIKASKPIEISTGIISISGNYYSQLTITTKKTFPEWQNYQNQNVNIYRSVWFKMKSRLWTSWALRNNLSPSSSDNSWPVNTIDNSPGKMVNLRIRSLYLYGAFIRICMAPVSVFVWCGGACIWCWPLSPLQSFVGESRDRIEGTMDVDSHRRSPQIISRGNEPV